MTKLRIDFHEGILEVEGEETFVKMVYQDYKDKFNFDAKSQSKHQATEQKFTNQSGKDVNRESVKKSPKPKNRIKESYAIVKDLDLSPKGGKQSLRDFYKEKFTGPAPAMEINAVFVYYLQKIAGITNITLSHIYTCYKDAGARVPAALRQSLLDTSHRKGWVDTSSFEKLVIATQGENFVEHDLPKPTATAK